MSLKFEEHLFIAGKVGVHLISSSLRTLIDDYRQFVEGSGERLDVVNPATKEKITSVHVAGAKEVDAAVDAAEKAWPAWANGDPSIRAKALNKLADLVEGNADSLAMAQTVEMGKVIHESMCVHHLGKVCSFCCDVETITSCSY